VRLGGRRFAGTRDGLTDSFVIKNGRSAGRIDEYPDPASDDQRLGVIHHYAIAADQFNYVRPKRRAALKARIVVWKCSAVITVFLTRIGRRGTPNHVQSFGSSVVAFLLIICVHLCRICGLKCISPRALCLCGESSGHFPMQ
jgi:hypothetical protein